MLAEEVKEESSYLTKGHNRLWSFKIYEVDFLAQMFDTLKLNKEFRRVYGRGKSQVQPLLVTYVLKRRAGGLRVGITAGKKVGGAVQRNRARRVIRAAFVQLVPQIKDGYDIVFVARTRTVTAKSTQVAEVMKSQLQAANALTQE